MDVFPGQGDLGCPDACANNGRGKSVPGAHAQPAAPNRLDMGFPKMGVPYNGCFLMENPFKMGDLGVPAF